MKSPFLLCRLTFALLAGASAPLLSAAEVSPTSPQNWPQWRGPLANGVAPQGTPPTRWSETERVKWKTKLPGFGSSTPIIWNDHVFALTAISTGKKTPPASAPAPEPAAAPGAPGERRRGGGMRSEVPSEAYQFAVVDLDRQTGKVRWQTIVREEVPHEGHHRDHGFASASPVTDGEHLYVSFGSRGIHCLDFAGKIIWQKELGKMTTRNAFGEGASPALHGDTLVIGWDHEGEDFIVALDKKTGAERWRQKRDEPTTWSTPLIFKHAGVVQVVINATNRIRSYDLATGAQLWECGGMTTNAIPSPVIGHGLLYAISGFRGAALLAIKLGGKGDLTGTDAIAWKHNKGTPYVPSPLLSGERFYFYSGNTGTLSCFQANTGQPIYEMQRIEGLLGGVYASPIAAAGHVFLAGRDGKTVVIKDADALEIVATNQLDDRFDASPAIAGKELFLRGHEHLYCLAE